MAEGRSLSLVHDSRLEMHISQRADEMAEEPLLPSSAARPKPLRPAGSSFRRRAWVLCLFLLVSAICAGIWTPDLSFVRPGSALAKQEVDACSTSIPVAVPAKMSDSGLVQERPRVEACPTDAFDSGRWVKKQQLINITDEASQLAASGYSGCAAKGYYFQKGGLENGGLDWPSFNGPMSWEWQPSDSCSLQEPSMRELVQSLVSEGGLLLVGDSISYQHFYQISCQLYPHVRWEGISVNPGAERHGERPALQHLNLDPTSQLVQELQLPDSFDMAKRPVVSWYATHFPISVDDLRRQPGVDVSLIPLAYPNTTDFDALYRQPTDLPIDFFMDEALRYRTMLVSFGAHVGPHAFPGADLVQLQSLLRTMTRVFYRRLQSRISPHQRVIARAGPPGHDPKVRYAGPTEEMPEPGNYWQWRVMPSFAVVARQELQRLQDSRFYWMDGERVARTRPDAHIHDDGLHFEIGAGIYETFSRYLWHLIAVL